MEQHITTYQLITSSALHLAGLKSKVLVRFTFNSSTLNVQTGSAGAPNVTGAVLLIEGAYEPPQVMNLKKELYMRSPLTIKFIDHQRFQSPQTLAASTTYTFTINSLNGLCALLFFGIRSATRTAANMLDWTPTANVSSFDIQTQTGESMLGNYARQTAGGGADEDLIVYSESGLDNLFPQNTGLIMVPFTENIKDTLNHGSNYGFNVFTTFEQIKFTTNSYFSGGSYNVECYGFMYNQLYLRNGDLIQSN